MKKYINPARELWDEITLRPAIDTTRLFDIVKPIIEDVRENGDEALFRYEEKFDNATLSSLIVTEEEMEEAEREILSKANGKQLIEAMNVAKANIEMFHAAQKFQQIEVTTQKGVRCWQRAVPIERVGLYVPGGSAPLFSTVLMLAIPAQLAGCKEIVLCTPPQKDGKVNSYVLYAAKLCGVSTIIKAGGSQAIAAMAYGTASVPRVDKIFGPGNSFVMAAKLWVSLQGVAIDMPAGPSEVQVIADKSCNPSYVAADLLSQAEHGPDSQVVLVCTDEDIADEVSKEIDIQLEKLPRRSIAEKALAGSRIVIFNGNDAARNIIDFTNAYGPEHLIIATTDAHAIADNIFAAGSIFLGNYACESAGDYASGTNHTLPTMGCARAYSGLSLDSFCRKMTLQELTSEGIESIGKYVEIMAEAEGLEAHANAMRIRRQM